ncbi:MAG TPA: type II toxin-antitoxin system VapB family antitoxin [Allosphingosinicella sp.]|jgi:hypothetical protein|nr:type II toxin-antitoxin system VapB family antitoxin [Allosphingosinicella sp.]
MSSYKPLADFLSRKKADQWDASFDDVERALGRPLPQSAYRYNAWWANQTGPGHSQTQGWRSVGWRTAKLDLERKRVRFEREGGGREEANQPGPERVDEGLVQRAMDVSDIKDRSAVINAALEAFIRRELVRFVEELGGSQPDFEAAPRERPWA